MNALSVFATTALQATLAPEAWPINAAGRTGLLQSGGGAAAIAQFLPIVAIGLQETVEFSLQMPGNVTLFALVCALAIHPPRETRSEDRPGVKPAERPRLRVVASNAFAGSR